MQTAKLFRLSNEPNDDGLLTLEPFNDERFNVSFVYDGSDTFDQLDELINTLQVALFGDEGQNFCIAPKDRFAVFYDHCDPYGHVVFAGGDVVIPSIIDWTDVPAESTFYVLSNSDFSSYFWVIAVPQTEADDG